MNETENKIKSKREIRKECQRKRDSLPESERRRLSETIAERLIVFSPVANAERILLYSSIGSEVSTLPMILRLSQLGKKLSLPHIEPGGSDFMPSDYAFGNPLVIGPYKVSQPRDFSPLDPRLIDLIIAPGVAFDHKGGRIGYGKGYYDRFLDNIRADAWVIGIAFNLQVIESVPIEPHDRLLNALVTESEISIFASPMKNA